MCTCYRESGHSNPLSCLKSNTCPCVYHCLSLFIFKRKTITFVRIAANLSINGSCVTLFSDVLPGGPVDKVRPGDEILEIEGVSMLGMRRLEAWSFIRRLPTGPVDVILRRLLKISKHED